ncbi:MAG: methyltransferase domain-containing protein [Anaerolineae bacterium]
MTNSTNDTIWQSAQVAYNFLDNVRGGIPLAGEQIDVMLRVIRAACPSIERFLDVGCGDGIMGRAVLMQYPSAQGVFLDFSEPMIEAAKAKTSGSHTFITQDYGTVEWLKTVEAHAPFDAIVSGFSIHHQPDARKRELYRELFHLLKPGGVFLNLEHVAPENQWVETLFDEIMVDTLYAHNQRSGTGKSREQVAAEFHARADKDANILAPVETQCHWLRDIGFSDVDCYLKIFELALFGGRRPA